MTDQEKEFITFMKRADNPTRTAVECILLSCADSTQDYYKTIKRRHTREEYTQALEVINYAADHVTDTAQKAALLETATFIETELLGRATV